MDPFTAFMESLFPPPRRRRFDQWRPQCDYYTFEVTEYTGQSPEQKHRDALIDIAHDTATIEAAQRRAREALKD